MVDPSLLAELGAEPGSYKAQASFEIAEHYRVRGRICRDSWNGVITRWDHTIARYAASGSSNGGLAPD